MPAMTNPDDYVHEYYDPKNPTKRSIMGHSQDEKKCYDGSELREKLEEQWKKGK